MACTSCGSGGCGTKTDNGISGCGSSGSCLTGGCNRLNTFDWLSDISRPITDPFNIVEVTFKNGSRKGFYANPIHTHTVTGDMVLVEAETGFDIGKISLSGELVKLQMKKKKVREDSIFASVIRKANDRDMDRLMEARSIEYKTMIRARAITRSLKLNMKVGDVEYQGDKRKATFFYTADGRVDFRELIKIFAREFRVKIEMRQIGARQESARLGGIGSCGRELCCSTWLTEFKSVSTAAARYQNLAINQAKLSGQCGRLKCCLNYELDSYMDALESFPDRADRLETEAGTAFLMKTDIFKGLMYYTYKNAKGFSKIYPLPVKRVKEILASNKKGVKPLELKANSTLLAEIPDMDYADVTGEIELKDDPKKRRRRNRNRNRNKNKQQENSPNKSKQGQAERKTDTKKSTPTNKQKQDNQKNTTKKESPKNNSRNKPQGRNQSRNNKNRNQPKGNPKPPTAQKEGNKNQSPKKSGQKNQLTNPNKGEKKGANQPKGKAPMNKRKNTNQKPKNNSNQKNRNKPNPKNNSNQKSRNTPKPKNNLSQKNTPKANVGKGTQKNQPPKRGENKNQGNKNASNKPKTGQRKPPFKNRFKKKENKNNSEDNGE